MCKLQYLKFKNLICGYITSNRFTFLTDIKKTLLMDMCVDTLVTSSVKQKKNNDDFNISVLQIFSSSTSCGFFLYLKLHL